MLRTEAEDVGVGDDETLMAYGFPKGNSTWQER